MNHENRIINSLWIGKELSNLEKLCISSFLAQGHIFHLYVYDEIQGVPNGTVIKEADSIIPEKDIFLGKRSDGTFGGIDAFSDYFRFVLLYEKGGWWVDMDVVCLLPFDFKEPFVFTEEINKMKSPRPTSGIIKAQKGSTITEYCCEKIRAYRNKTKIEYMEIGPNLITDAIFRFRKCHYIKGWKIFMPIGQWELEKFIEPNTFFNLDDNTEIYSIHFWNESWRYKSYDKNSKYHPKSIYEQLKSIYLK
jgi:hypothetical protein